MKQRAKKKIQNKIKTIAYEWEKKMNERMEIKLNGENV